jgi:hypothetical protein
VQESENSAVPPEKHGENRNAGKRARKARATPESEPEKKLGRDGKGRWLVGASGNSRGRPPITPEMKMVRELCEVEREANVAELVRLRDTAADPWVRIEAIKMLLLYSDGKPVTAIASNGPLVNVNIANGAPITSAAEAAAFYASILGNPSADLSQIRFASPATDAAVIEHAPAVDPIVAEVPSNAAPLPAALPKALDARIAPIEADTSTWVKLADEPAAAPQLKESLLERRRREHAEANEQERLRQREAGRIRAAKMSGQL